MPWLRSLVILLVCSATSFAGDWPQWLGPNRDGASPERVAPWKQPPRVLWRHKTPEGNSAPVVAEGRIFIHAKVRGQDEEEVVARDARTGKHLWRRSYERPAFRSLYGNGPRATPSVVDGKVYTFGITGLLTCFEASSGKQLWQVDALKEFAARNLFFGMSCSPLVDGKLVFFNVGGKGSSVVALDKDSGRTVWKSLDDRASYSSPILFGNGNRRQLVCLTGDGLVSLNPADGALHWRFPLRDRLFESSTTPVRVGDLLLASSITYGSVGLDLKAKEGKPAFKEAWKNTKLTSYFSTPVPVGAGHVYMVTGSNPLDFKNAAAALHCIDGPTGKVLWTRPSVGKYHASLLRTGNDKLLMLEEAGNLVLIDPDPKGYRELARSKVCGETWAHPALSDGRLFVRDNKELICVDLSPR